MSVAGGSASARGLHRLRALVVCLSFALLLPAAGGWELTWPARVVATLVSATVSGAAVSGAARSALAARAVRPRQQRALVLAFRAEGALQAPARGAQVPPRCDGRWLYLEQCSLSC